MKATLIIGSALAAFLFATSSWAQSLTPIQGWIPLDSAKAKSLMQTDRLPADRPAPSPSAAGR